MNVRSLVFRRGKVTVKRRVGRRTLASIVVGAVIGAGVVLPFQLATGAQSAGAADAAKFDPAYIIADRYFYDANAMSVPEIQSFLDSQVGTCTNGACLNVLTIAFSGASQFTASQTGNLVCTAIPAGNFAVSHFIYIVQQACGISARVLLVTLQKEQALISGPNARAPSQSRLNIAMGYACPDTAACDTRYYGVGNQLYWGARQLKYYSAGRVFRQPGPHYIQWSPNSACGGTWLDIRNYATAALYNYTPYQPNAAALANLYGTGDGCSSYGNRNFWRLYSDWFGNPVGNSPIGWLDTATVSGTTIVAKGWALDIDLPLGAASVQLRVDGVVVGSGYAVENRPGLAAAVLPEAGDNHGYTLRANVGVGTHTVCVIGLDSAGAPPSTLLYGGAGGVNNCAVVTVSAPPDGWIDSVNVLGSKVTVSGWALDPNTSAPVEVRLLVDGSIAATVTADSTRPGLAAAIGSTAGDDHGFALSAQVSMGSHTICVVAVNDAPGPDGSIRYAGPGAANNCARVNYPGPQSPMGWIDSVTTVGDTVTASGWTIDPDTAAAVPVQLVVDGVVVATGSANLSRSGLGAATLPAAGDDHGYLFTTKVSTGQHTICVIAVDDAVGPSTRLSYVGAGASNNCALVNYTGPRSPIGWMDAAVLNGTNLTTSGWTIDPDTAGSVMVQMSVDGAIVATALAATPRPGLGRAYPGYGDDHGYSMSTTLTWGTHTVCMIAVDHAGGTSTRLLYVGAAASSNCVVVSNPGSSSPVGWLDAVTLSDSILTATGWSIDPDTAGAVEVQLIVDGVVVTSGLAGLPRPGLGAAVGMTALGDAHGYSLSATLGSGTHTVCVVGLNDAPGIDSTLRYRGANATNNCAVVTR